MVFVAKFCPCNVVSDAFATTSVQRGRGAVSRHETLTIWFLEPVGGFSSVEEGRQLDKTQFWRVQRTRRKSEERTTSGGGKFCGFFEYSTRPSAGTKHCWQKADFERRPSQIPSSSKRVLSELCAK